MRHSVAVKIEDSERELVQYGTRTVLRDFEVAFIEVGEEITPLEALHNDKYLIVVFEHVEQADDIGVLHNFKNFNFALQ